MLEESNKLTASALMHSLPCSAPCSALADKRRALMPVAAPAFVAWLCFKLLTWRGCTDTQDRGYVGTWSERKQAAPVTQTSCVSAWQLGGGAQDLSLHKQSIRRVR